MPSIDIRHKHKKATKEAKQAVTDVAREISQKFDLTYGWDGDVLHFERSGVSGKIALEKGLVHVTAELGFLLSMLKPTVEKEIEKRLVEHFGAA
ncbi:polyhydroxyalkanoic acid system family protein [Tahibacter amnicola]|uniref:Polyhydroxyalkanoic acid system family protein n=1 Tax=Tahibacter amnicola TaxID=2976241 RepID=A0ABY6B9C7_9GAMM|nr:polyhydroxyalkanoic acid system family protein [Tahibacter amnicola]UXI66663.1 polyhydroxyalkanoic acid system family protein [Tahibacter amnicola]